MNSERCQTLYSNVFMVYVEHRKKSSANNKDTSAISQNLSGFPSKPRNFIGDGSICEDSTWQRSPNHLKFLPLHYEVKSWHHAKFELFLTYFTFSLFSETKKSIYDGVRHNLFACRPSDFSYIRHTHVEKTIREIFLAIFLQ